MIVLERILKVIFSESKSCYAESCLLKWQECKYVLMLHILDSNSMNVSDKSHDGRSLGLSIGQGGVKKKSV